MNDEPALIGGAISSVLILLVAFGVPITPDQIHAILGAAAALIALATALMVRSKVTPAK